MLHAPPFWPLQDTLERRLAGSRFRSASVDNPYVLLATKSIGLEWIADGQQTLKDFLGLVIALLSVHEVRAAHIILKSLASSELADAEVTCSQSVFKSKVADVVNSNSHSFSPSAFVGIQHWCRGGSAEVFIRDEDFESQSAPDLTHPASPSAVDLQYSSRGSSRRSWSRTNSSRSSGSLASEDGEGRADLSSLRWPRSHNQIENVGNSCHHVYQAQQLRGQPRLSHSLGAGNHQLRPQLELPRFDAEDEREQFMRGVRDEDESLWRTTADGPFDTREPSKASFDCQENLSFD